MNVLNRTLNAPTRAAVAFGLLGWSLLSAAQTVAVPVAPTVTAPMSAVVAPATPAPEVVAGSTAVEPTAPTAPVAPVAPAAPVVSCRPITDQAMAVDLAAVTAQSKKADLAEQSTLFKQAVALWTQAIAACEGRAKERAQRNRDDDQQMLDQLAEKLSSGPQCTAAFKDASALQDMARQTLAERRWQEASSLFRKAENMWDFATERCSGSQQDDANRRREQSAQDSHNAQYCAPLFEKARETTQKLRSNAASLSREDKQDSSMVAETLWREAITQCRGVAVQDIATNNAKALARDRGTPWVPRQAPASEVRTASSGAAPAPVAATGLMSGLAQSVQSAPSAVMSALSFSGAPASAAAKSVSAVPPVAAALASVAPVATREPAAHVEPAVPDTPGVITAGTTRFVGQFVTDAGASTVSGSGKVTWATGDVFEGSLSKGLRQGRGVITWANGQRYEGDWQQDKPTGQGKMKFANGNDYEGQLIDGTPQGKGRMRYASGDVYEGQFKDGEPDQTGTYVWRNGQSFEGAWKKGRPSGQGKLKFATGNQFEGTVVDGVPQGQGRMVFAGGEVYVGQFVDGQPDGEGAFTWPTGDQYAGQWKAGKKHGKGVFTWKTGDRWEGIYDNDVQKN